MAYGKIDSEKLTAIGDAIREKKGMSDLIPIDDMPNEILSISGGDVDRVSWHQCPEAVRNYLANVTYNSSDYATSQIANYAPSVAVASNTKPIGTTSGGVTYYNEVPNVQTPFANSQTAGTLQPLDRLRWIKCNTAPNVRDLGGWSCDGGTVRYGLLIRGGECGANDAEVLVNQCGVRHEMNLRGRQESGRTSSVLGNIGYSIYDTFAWYSLSNTTLWRQMMQTVFDCINKSIPIYFHCSAGADRTGTLACVLEALLGMSQSDIDKDYELTCFYTGTDTDQHGRRRDETEWKNLINAINAFSGSTFRDKAVRFVMSLGFSIEDINKFRAVMINGTPEILVSTTYTVTNTMTHVTNSNNAEIVDKGQLYSAALMPDANHVISAVTVTMGGADITSQVFSGTATVRRFAVNTNLSHCHSDAPKAAAEGAALTIHLEADADYTMVGASVTVTMGGNNVSQYYSSGTITIPNVTGDIVITATAIESAPLYTNLVDTTASDYMTDKRYNSSGALVDASGADITNKIPFTLGNCKVRTNIDLDYIFPNQSNYGRIYLYDSTGAYKDYTYANNTTTDTAAFTDEGNGITLIDMDALAAKFQARFNGATYFAIGGVHRNDPVVTINEPIEQGSQGGEQDTETETVLATIGDITLTLSSSSTIKVSDNNIVFSELVHSGDDIRFRADSYTVESGTESLLGVKAGFFENDGAKHYTGLGTDPVAGVRPGSRMAEYVWLDTSILNFDKSADLVDGIGTWGGWPAGGVVWRASSSYASSGGTYPLTVSFTNLRVVKIN